MLLLQLLNDILLLVQLLLLFLTVLVQLCAQFLQAAIAF